MSWKKEDLNQSETYTVILHPWGTPKNGGVKRGSKEDADRGVWGEGFVTRKAFTKDRERVDGAHVPQSPERGGTHEGITVPALKDWTGKRGRGSLI